MPSQRKKTIVYELATCRRGMSYNHQSYFKIRVKCLCNTNVLSKELTERHIEALKYRKEVSETEPHLAIKLDYPAVLRSRPTVSRSKWKVEKPF